MRIGTNNFRGELPHLAPEALPDQGAQEATNCRLETGNLESYRQFAETHVLENSGTVQTIFLAQDPGSDASAWLSFNEQVDIARNVIEDDPDGLLLLTCPDLYDTPVYTTYDDATDGAEPFPVAGSLLPLGVPGPGDIPTLVLGVDTTPTTFSIDITDAGDELETSWVTSTPRAGSTFSTVVQDDAEGDPSPCYRLRYDEIHNPGEAPWARRNFGIEKASLIQVSAGMRFSGDTSVRNGWLGVATDEAGAGVLVGILNGALQIRNSTLLEWYGSGLVDEISAPGLTGGVWYTLEVKITNNPAPANTQTVEASIKNGSTVIAAVTATNNFTIGGHCFLSAAIPDDSGGVYCTDFDNIHVQASGSTGITPNLTATNYLYTFVNDRGWESVPSLPTADVLRPDGVAVTVTTSTTAPAGYSAVTLKRIYRLVSALTGDLYLLVAEIPLAQADFVDNLQDNEVGPDVLESQDFDLPPATLEGILALPNGGYAGFFGKQLCISAAGWPHAWPLKQRHSCEFDIVGIAKLGNTIVVGTTGRAYTCTGTEPSNYVMSEPGESQACVSKRGMVFLDGQGVAFPSPDGYQLCTGSAGNLRNLTENVFTKRQWQEKNPSSIIAAVHDGVLHWYWETVAPATETVLFLFHMTDTASSEGIAEFTEVAQAFDQTGANWYANNTSLELTASFPYPPFGAFCSSGESDVTWERDKTPSNPEVPAEFSTSGKTTLQVSTWIYIQANAANYNAVYEWSVGNFTYPLPEATLTLRLAGDGAEAYTAVVSYQPPDAGEQISNPVAVPLDQWVQLLLSYTLEGEFASLDLYVDGVNSGFISEFDMSQALTDVNPINDMRVATGGPGVYVDEMYAVLGATAITEDFTPPVAPWPNP